MNKTATVGIGDMKIIRQEGLVATYALGSCIGICLYDPYIKLAGLIHIMLPEAPAVCDNVYKYADSGIKETLRKMEAFGGIRRRMIAKIAGGSKMFDIPGNNDFGNIGDRNAEAVQKALRTEGIIIKAKDIGGSVARTVFFNADDGNVLVKSFGRPDKTI